MPNRFKLIACNVVQRELCAAVARSPNIVDLEFLELGLHERSEKLNQALQTRIDAASAARAPGGEAYDAVLLGYGLCGNGSLGLEARNIPMVMPRAHDCCTLLLGSRAEFLSRFGDRLSASWSSAGYIERGSTYFRASELGETSGIGLEYAELVARYGEENAAYVWETLHPERAETELRFIETPETSGLGYSGMMAARAEAEGKTFLRLQGSSRLLEALLAGAWDEEEFLVLKPGERVEPAYDHEVVVKAGGAG
jgi:hypothetical protein